MVQQNFYSRTHLHLTQKNIIAESCNSVCQVYHLCTARRHNILCASSSHLLENPSVSRSGKKKWQLSATTIKISGLTTPFISVSWGALCRLFYLENLATDKDSFWLITSTDGVFPRYQSRPRWRKGTITSNKVNNKCDICSSCYTDYRSKQQSIYFRHDEIKQEVTINDNYKRSNSPWYSLEKEKNSFPIN